MAVYKLQKHQSLREKFNQTLTQNSAQIQTQDCQRTKEIGAQVEFLMSITH